MSNFDEKDELSRELRDRSRDVGGHPIGLDAVKGSARKIAWRRRAATGVVAAAVLAVAVPAGLAVSNSATNSRGPVEQPTPAGPSPDQQPVERRLNTTSGLEKGDAPRIDYLAGWFLHESDGDVVDLGAGYEEITPYGDGWIAVGMDDNGNRSAYFLGADGSIRSSERIVDGLALSPDGKVVAYSTPDRRLMVVWDGEGSPVRLDTPDAGGISPVVMSAADDCAHPYPQSACAVYYNVDGQKPRAFRSFPNGGFDPLVIEAVNDVSASGAMAGRVSHSLTGSCSAVYGGVGDEQRWQTCDFRLGRFSPDGRHILATNAYGDGFGDTELAILDADTGRTLAHYDGKGQDGNGVFIQDMVWEDDSHVLAVTFQQGTWMVIRLDAEGNVEQATEAVPADDMSRPYYFSTRPATAPADAEADNGP